MKLSDYFSIKDAAEYLGISQDTLRRWDKAKKLKPYRHPINNYRLYKKEDLDKLLQAMEEVKG